MENLEWFAVPFNGLETNLEVTKCGRVRRIKVDWMRRNRVIGEVNFNLLKLTKQGYKTICIQIKGLKLKNIFVHQLIATTFLGYKFNGHKIVVDHIDSNKLNNHIENLRIVTQRINVSKEKSIKSGLPTGVCFRKNIKRYQSRIQIDGKNLSLGYYNTQEEASKAYINKLESL